MFDDPFAHRVFEQMQVLERVDAGDRIDDTPRRHRLRQIPPDTGRFLAILAAGAPPGAMIEIGTSAGYSTLWLALACNATGRRLTTFEVSSEKVELARETFQEAEVDHLIDVVEGDALEYLGDISEIAFCFLDAEKEIYADCYGLVIPHLVDGGLLVADNAINHRQTLQPFLDEALSDPRVDAVIVPIGKGELVCRRI